MKNTKNKKIITKEQVMAALKGIIDPEIGISLVEMNLIKEVLIKGDKVKIKMTLTTPGCPLASHLVNEVKKKVENLAGVAQAQVELVWD